MGEEGEREQHMGGMQDAPGLRWASQLHKHPVGCWAFHSVPGGASDGREQTFSAFLLPLPSQCPFTGCPMKDSCRRSNPVWSPGRRKWTYLACTSHFCCSGTPSLWVQSYVEWSLSSESTDSSGAQDVLLQREMPW